MHGTCVVQRDSDSAYKCDTDNKVTSFSAPFKHLILHHFIQKYHAYIPEARRHHPWPILKTQIEQNYSGTPTVTCWILEAVLIRLMTDVTCMLKFAAFQSIGLFDEICKVDVNVVMWRSETCEARRLQFSKTVIPDAYVIPINTAKRFNMQVTSVIRLINPHNKSTT